MMCLQIGHSFVHGLQLMWLWWSAATCRRSTSNVLTNAVLWTLCIFACLIVSAHSLFNAA